MRPVPSGIKTNLLDPAVDYARVLPRSNVRRAMQAAREQIVVGAQRRRPDPCLKGLPGRSRDLELYRALRLLLEHNCSRSDPIAVTNVPNAQLHEVTAAKFAIYAEVEQRKISSAALYLEPDADGPDVLNLERRLLPDKLSLVPRLAPVRGNGCVYVVLLFSLKGEPWSTGTPRRGKRVGGRCPTRSGSRLFEKRTLSVRHRCAPTRRVAVGRLRASLKRSHDGATHSDPVYRRFYLPL